MSKNDKISKHHFRKCQKLIKSQKHQKNDKIKKFNFNDIPKQTRLKSLIGVSPTNNHLSNNNNDTTSTS